MFYEIWTVIDGALDTEARIRARHATDLATRLSFWINRYAASLDVGQTADVFVRLHDHAPHIDCECAQYETDHHPHVTLVGTDERDDEPCSDAHGTYGARCMFELDNDGDAENGPPLRAVARCIYCGREQT